MLEPKVVPPEGSGLHQDEVTIAELLSKAGYNTVHIGKWHQGDIEQAFPHNQGFDIANFPIHNQATFNLMTRDAEEEAWANNVAVREVNANYRLDANFRPSGWVLGVEAKRGGKAKEWGVKAGEELGYEYYRKLNNRYKDQVIEQLQRLAKDDKPFFLNYWPQRPIDFGRVGREFRTANGGVWVESMAEEDEAIGDILQEVDRLGLTDNTIVMLMGDNGPMRQALGRSGFTDMIYRGYKAESLEGGIRVNAFIRWPQAIEAGAVVGDMIHVTDVYTTFARIAQGTEYIPRDRIVDGVDQSSLLFLGDTHGRRDYIHVYEGPHLKATIKEQYKVHWPAPGEPSFKLPVFDLYRDPREERPLKVEAMWTVAYFGDMRARHMAFKKKYPDRPETIAKPYEGIENLRPETQEFLDNYYAARKLLDP
jgi:arylsulfatase